MLKIISVLIHASAIVLARYRPLEEFAKSDDPDFYGYEVSQLANFDDVASHGLVNFADLGHYGAADYTGLGRLLFQFFSAQIIPFHQVMD